MTVVSGLPAGAGRGDARDDRILVYGTDLFERGGHWGQVRGLGEEFGRDRVRNAPISEAAMVAAGVGAAMNGLRPVVDLNFIDFAFGGDGRDRQPGGQGALHVGHRCRWSSAAPTACAGGGAQHNNSFEAWFAHTPGLLVAMPSTAGDTKGLIKTALRGEDPVIFLMHKRAGRHPRRGRRRGRPGAVRTRRLCVVRARM